MLLPNEGVELLFKHTNSILNIYHFDFNDKNHYISLSDDGEIIEWYFNEETFKVIEIAKFHLKRPNDDLLFSKKHKIRTLKKDEYYKITQVIQFDNFLALGYSDGIILVYEITKKQQIIKPKTKKVTPKLEIKNIDQKSKEESKEEELNEENLNNDEEENSNNEEEKNSNNEEEKNSEDKVENESNINFNDIQSEEIKKENNEEKEEEKEEKKEEEIEEETIDLDYYNFFRLYYVLLGHFREIRSLCYIPQTKMIISSSDDQTIKIFDFNTGHLIYYFKLDFIINRILFQNVSKNKNEAKIVLTLLSNDPVRVVINLFGDSITYNNYFFKYNDILQLEKINNKFYVLNDKNVLLLDSSLELEGKFISLYNVSFHYFNKFQTDFLIADNENCIRIVELIQKNKLKENNATEKNKKKEKNKKTDKNKNEENAENEEKTFENIIRTDCKFKVGEDLIKGFYFVDSYIFVFCQDGKLYLVNYNKIKENYERVQMAFEDLASLQMNNNLVTTKKPKKKGKGKKGKEKKK